MKIPTAPANATGSYNTTTNNYATSTILESANTTTTVAPANTTTTVAPANTTTTVAPANKTTTVASANTTARPAATTTKKPEPVKEESCCQICTNTLGDIVCNDELFKCQPGACYDEIGSHGCQVILDKDYCSNKTNAKKTCKLSCQLCDLANIGSIVYIKTKPRSVYLSVDGNWAAWEQWGDCSVSCNNGTRLRMRNCTDPAPENDGEECHGNSTETEDCSGGDRCPADGEWGTWSRWTGCSKTCGVGMRHRDRNCDDPYPEADGLFCLGEAREYEICYNKSCEDGHWDAWSDWGTCSTTCGFGYISRTRNCSVPSLFGHACLGESKQTIMCVIDCNDGLWDDWSSWGTCSRTCGVGQMSRDRNCNSNGILGRSCVGKDSETVLCHSEACESALFIPQGKLYVTTIQKQYDSDILPSPRSVILTIEVESYKIV
ncbi:HMCN1-like protein [Mya arenaria]|uniref:HMCN1-like protein n=1 Tax=Mya arenaria TaxID=6604 RepID=A0ABY7ELX8_MYAAR|nr:HMCN1-like protein [Mya arenaria]